MREVVGAGDDNPRRPIDIIVGNVVYNIRGARRERTRVCRVEGKQRRRKPGALWSMGWEVESELISK